MKIIKSVLIMVCIFFVIYLTQRMKNDYVKEEVEFPVEIVTNDAENNDIDINAKQLEVLIKGNEFEEKVICIYEGIAEFESLYDKYALYKETVEKDIIFVNMLFVEKETESIYTWRGEELVQIGILEDIQSNLTDSLEFDIDNHLLFENLTEDELLDKVMETLKRGGCNSSKLIYDGTIEFLNRNYYMVSAFDDFEDHIIRGQSYYIDIENGYTYYLEENAEFLRTELHYIGNLQ